MQHTKQLLSYSNLSGRVATLYWDGISSPALEILRDFPLYLACLVINSKHKEASLFSMVKLNLCVSMSYSVVRIHTATKFKYFLRSANGVLRKR